MFQPDCATIESWKAELAEAATTRAKIKALVLELEGLSDDKISIELIIKKIKRLDPYWGMF
jgi:hypothetical protein